MSTNVRKFRFPFIFDTCDVVYNWSISLLPPIVFYNLFDLDRCYSCCLFARNISFNNEDRLKLTDLSLQ